MIRFVDLRPADIAGIRFAFWDTVHNRFEEFAGDQAWGTLDDFDLSLKLSEEVIEEHVKRLVGLCPDWVHEPWDMQNDWREWKVVEDKEP